MSWFDTKSFASGFKTALKEAQKKIDKVLDIQEELDGGSGSGEKDDVTNLSEDKPPIDMEPVPKLRSTVDTSEVGQCEQMITNLDLSKKLELTYDVKSTDDLPEKRLSMASTLDSVDLLSPPQITPCSDEIADISESVELITATADLSSDSETILPETVESIVIIGSTCDTGIEEERELLENDALIVCNEDTPRSSLTVDINSTTKSFLHSNDDTAYELQTIDSDSTQSFEDVQLQQSIRSDSESNTQDAKQKGKNSKSNTASAHTSNDEMETATSSDIEIISNPNGDGSSTASTTTRTSPLKVEKKLETSSTSTNPMHSIVNNGARKGHFREPSEISILSIDSPSEDEVEKLLKRISELNGIVEARELRLLQSEQHNSELQDRNNELLALVNAEKLQPSEEYTKRLSALEKKFQNCIRERDTLRIEIKDLQTKIPKNDLTDALVESQCMVTELRLEGDKLSKEILQQSNIIKKLRSKEKTTDTQLKNIKDQLASMSEEIERLKKTLSAKEDVERTQIEAVHKMSSENQRLDKENVFLRGKLDDTQQRLNTLQRSFDAVKTELQQRSKQHSDLSRTAESIQAAEREKVHFQTENQEFQRQIHELREKLRSTELATIRREQQLREENRNLMDRLEAAEFRAEISTQEISQTTIPLMRHLESLQQTLNQRTNNWNREEKCLLEKLEASQKRLQTLEYIEEQAKCQIDSLKSHSKELEERLANQLVQEEKTKIALQLELKQKESDHNRQISEVIHQLEQSQIKIKTLEDDHFVMQQCLNDAENKITSSVECLQRGQSTNSLVDLQNSISDPTHRHSPAVSAGINSLEDGMGGSTDWQQDDLDCISNSGRPPHGQGLGFNYVSYNTTNFEYLQSMLKQRDGELSQCQWELSRLQAERNVLHEQISQLSIEIENLKDKLETYELMEVNHNDLQTRYDALLQMYGEKVERSEELELDLKECKEAYKVQIQELLKNLKT